MYVLGPFLWQRFPLADHSYYRQTAEERNDRLYMYKPANVCVEPLIQYACLHIKNIVIHSFISTLKGWLVELDVV